MQALRQRLSLFLCYLFLVCCVWVMLDKSTWRDSRILNWDAAGYHAYLPATIVYNDLFHLRYYGYVDSVYHPSGDQRRYALFEHPETGRTYNKYTSGVAIMGLPAFLVTHACVKLFSHYPADGYSAPYQLGSLLNGALFAFFGLLVLRRLLKAYFSDAVTAIVLAVLGFGTNIWEYAAFDPGMSHLYLFFLYAVVLLGTKRLLEQPALAPAVCLGLALGLCAMIRPTDAFVAVFPLCWGLSSVPAVKERLRFLRRHFRLVLLALLASFLPVFIQMLYWKATTSHWIFFSYTGEQFFWNRCEVWAGLFSYKKGWFVYTPLALLGFAGFFRMLRRCERRFYVLPFALYFTLSFYVLFCWGNWWYGGSFGCRALLQSGALLALPTGFLVQSARARWQQIALGIVIPAGIYLNLFQTWQFSKYIITDQSMNRAYYWRVFLKKEATEEDRKLL